MPEQAYTFGIFTEVLSVSKSVAKKEQSNASSKIKKQMKHTHEHNPFLSLLTISPSVSLMKAECVGEGSRDAWLHTVNPPEQHSCTFQVRAHTHRLQSLSSVNLTSGQPSCQSLPLSPLFTVCLSNANVDFSV